MLSQLLLSNANLPQSLSDANSGNIFLFDFVVVLAPWT